MYISAHCDGVSSVDRTELVSVLSLLEGDGLMVTKAPLGASLLCLLTRMNQQHIWKANCVYSFSLSRKVGSFWLKYDAKLGSHGI